MALPRLYLQSPPEERLRTAIEMAQSIYNVPPMIMAEDFANDAANIDELSVIMYVTVLAIQLNKRVRRVAIAAAH